MFLRQSRNPKESRREVHFTARGKHAMAPPRIPGGGRGRGRGGYKGRMGKKLKKNPDGSDKPKRKKTGFGIWGVGAIFAAMLGLVGLAAKRENDVREAADSSLRGRLRRRPIEFSEHA